MLPSRVLAQANFARMRAPLDDPRLAEFAEALEPINALAEASAGFVWRLKDEGGDATSLRAYPDPLVLGNVSLWTSTRALHDYVFGTLHRDYLGRRREWFESSSRPRHALWWIDAAQARSVMADHAGGIALLMEGRRRVEHLAEHGASAETFDLAWVTARANAGSNA